MKESTASPWRPKSSRSFVNSKLTTFPQLPSSVYYDQMTISSPNLTSFQNYSNIIKSPSGNKSCLVYLKLDNTGIANYKGALRTPSLKYIFLSGTPLSTYHYYRVMTAIVFGADTLEEIDHTPIKKSERLFSVKNSDLLYPYLIDGWLLTMVDPIRIFDPATRRRRVLYPLPVKRKNSLLNSTIYSLNQKLANQQPVSDKKATNSQAASQQTTKQFSKDGTEFLSFLEKIFFENNLNDLFKQDSPDKNDDSTISDLKTALSKSKNNSNETKLFESDASLFVNFVLRAAALRPLNVDSIVRLLKEVLTDEIFNILKQSLFHTNFYSNSALANFIESLLDQNVFTTEDVKPLFFSVYERFENWNSPFSLNSIDEEQTNGSKFLMIPFIDFFCPFSNLIEKVDSELYNSLLEQAGENEKERIETYRKNDKKKKEIWQSLLNDDYTKFASLNENEEQNNDSFTEEQIKQCVIDLTPWDVKEQQIEVAFAFSGSPQCLLHSSLFNDDINSSELLKVAAVAGGSFEIFNKIFNGNNNSDNAIELAENAIRFHRFEMLKEITNSMVDDVSELSSLVEIAIDSMEVNAINYIVVDKKVEIDKDTNEALFNRAFASAASIINSDLDQASKSRFMNPLNSLLSGSLSLQKAFVIFLYKVGFRSSDVLIFSIQSQSIGLVSFFLSCENNNSKSKIINRRGLDHLRWTPLHVASNIGNVEIVKELMKVNEINPNFRDKDGNTPLMIAVSNNFDDVVKELLKGRKGVKRAKSLQTSNQLNRNNKNSPPAVDPNIADKYGWTPILVAIGNKNIPIVKMLLDYNKDGKSIDINQVAYVNQNDKESENDDGIDVDIDNHSNISTEEAAAAGSGMTPLNLAVDVGDEEIFNLLLNRSDIDVNAKSLGGDSALSIAVKKRNLQFINELISTKKVSKEVIDSAIKVANNLGLTEIAQLLNNFNQ